MNPKTSSADDIPVLMQTRQRSLPTHDTIRPSPRPASALSSPLRGLPPTPIPYAAQNEPPLGPCKDRCRWIASWYEATVTAEDESIPASTVERWFAILRAIARVPGASPEALQAALEADLRRRWSMATLYNDVRALKQRGMLDVGRHRQGYHLSGAAFSSDELHVLLNGLRIQAEDLGNPMAQELYNRLARRAGRSRDEQAYMRLAVEAIANRPVVRTTVDGFADVMAHLREPILHGQVVEVRMQRQPWESAKRDRRRFTVIPLQFIFHDVAWYLLVEGAEDGLFRTLRVDRLHPAIEIQLHGARGSARQAERQAQAWELLRRGWAMAMPAHERSGRLGMPLATFELRFAAEVAPFILENERRHDTQRIKRLPDGAVWFAVELPTDGTVVFQFRRWVLTWGRSVEVLAPSSFRAALAEEYHALVSQYDQPPTRWAE